MEEKLYTIIDDGGMCLWMYKSCYFITDDGKLMRALPSKAEYLTKEKASELMKLAEIQENFLVGKLIEIRKAKKILKKIEEK